MTLQSKHALHHHQSNGLAEKAVSVCKQILKKLTKKPITEMQ